MRQLQWWAETEVVSPAQVKHARRYTAEDLFTVFLLHDLLQRGFQLHIARRICRELGRKASPVAHRWLVTNGQRVLLLSGEPELIAFLEQRRYPVYSVVALDKLQARMDKRVAECAPILRKPAVRAMEFAAMLREALRA